MNETLYSWTFKFHKVVRQQNSSAVEDFVLPYSAVHICQSYRKNKSGAIFMAHSVSTLSAIRNSPTWLMKLFNIIYF